MALKLTTLNGLGLTKAGAAQGAQRIVDYLSKTKVTTVQAAYLLATVHHETAGWMQPIREGAVRYGPNYSDANARAAVATLYGKRIIRTNYALPAGPYQQSYYGRGLVQITWYDNYAKFAKLLGVPLDKNPDLALDWNISLDITFRGLTEGLFRPGKGTLYNITSPAGYNLARELVNGDRAKNGKAIADIANKYLKNLKEESKWPFNL